MTRLLLATAASIAALVSNAGAQEAPFDWSGFYVGIQAGYGWSDVDIDREDEEFDLSEDGFLGGLHVGYDRQNGNFVYGLMGDFDLVDIEDGSISDTVGTGKFENYNYDLDWVATARVRGGFAFDRTLAFASGGLALGGMEASGEYVSLPDSFSEVDDWSGVKAGGALGLGLEHAFTDQFSGRIEYVHYLFDDIELTLDGEPLTFNPSFGALKFGISYRF